VTPEDIDRMLADDEEVVPSTGYEALVMEAVLRELTTPPPLAFPWLRALPGFMALLLAFAVAVWHGIGALNDPSVGIVFDHQLRALLDFGTRAEIQWTVLAVLLTILSVVLPLNVMRGRL